MKKHQKLSKKEEGSPTEKLDLREFFVNVEVREVKGVGGSLIMA